MRRVLLSAAVAALVAGPGSLAGPAAAGGGCHGDVTIQAVTQVGTSPVCWKPVVARVRTGATLAFVNDGSMDHNLSGPGPIGAHELRMGQTVRLSFPVAGVYPFSCSLHPAMAGAVVVGDPLPVAAESAAAPVTTTPPAVSLATPDSGPTRTGTAVGAGAVVVASTVGAIALRRRRAALITP